MRELIRYILGKMGPGRENRGKALGRGMSGSFDVELGGQCIWSSESQGESSKIQRQLWKWGQQAVYVL